MRSKNFYRRWKIPGLTYIPINHLHRSEGNLELIGHHVGARSDRPFARFSPQTQRQIRFEGKLLSQSCCNNMEVYPTFDTPPSFSSSYWNEFLDLGVLAPQNGL